MLAGRIEDPPEIETAWDWIWRAWWTLGKGDRPMITEGIGAPMGGTLIRSAPGFIPWSVMQRWIEVHDLDDVDGALLQHCVALMDQELIAWWREANKVESNG
ncbi:MAG: hypothetical protein ABMA15_18415 [Vicinamibacterales bacterium]